MQSGKTFWQNVLNLQVVNDALAGRYLLNNIDRCLTLLLGADKAAKHNLGRSLLDSCLDAGFLFKPLFNVITIGTAINSTPSTKIPPVDINVMSSG